ncbi:MAG: 50S ribosomal protein L6 [Proteobacteria bacterium]|nr:MAG: 50S ribosomal protein L6 [Pseudomonadota bacterium]
MSRIAKYPVNLPNGVELQADGGMLSVKGPKGELTMPANPLVRVAVDDGAVTFDAVSEEKKSRAMSGTMRALVNNMVIGVSTGFERKLNIVGVGYRAQAQGNKLNLSLGFSHPVVYELPEGVTAETPSQTEIIVKGSDKQKVGQVAAEIRAYRPPEPYKGKGVRYSDEHVVRKQAKKK